MILLPVILLMFGYTRIPEGTITDAQGSNGLGWVFFGMMVGVAYFMLSEIGQVADNRSYTANIFTDIFAFIGSGWLITRGSELDEGIIAFIGAAIFTIHTFQFIWKKGMPNLPF